MTDPALPPAAPPPNRWMRFALTLILTSWLLLTVMCPRPTEMAPFVPDVHFLEDFAAKNVDTCLPEGFHYRDWKFAFSGYGCNSVVEAQGKRWFRVEPKSATKLDETHAALIVGPKHGEDLIYTCEVMNRRQLRKGNRPNPWETGWVLWSYRDRTHAYYFALKTNGWELGKLDPEYRGAQRFLASGTQVKAGLNERHQVQIVQRANRIVVFVDGKEVARTQDDERPYLGGRIGVYCEDAEVLFSGISSSS